MKLPKLERYNQIVWAIVGTGVTLIASVALVGGLAALLYGWLKPDRGAVPVEIIEENTNQGKPRQGARYDFCQPLSVYGSPYQLIRVVSDRFVMRNKSVTLKQNRKFASGYSAGETLFDQSCGIYGSDNPSAVINVLARNADNGAMHLMLKENAMIHALEYPQPPVDDGARRAAASFPPTGMMYWEIAFEDSNGDNFMDEHDDIGAYLSDVEGKHFTRITPPASRVLEKTYDSKRRKLLLRIVRDSNQDKTLDDRDTPSLIEVDLAQRKLTGEILDATKLTEWLRRGEPQRTRSATP